MPTATPVTSAAAGSAGETGAQRLYREDGWAWAMEQAAAPRRSDVDAIDWEN